MSNEREQVETVLSKMNEDQVFILREILQAEKNYLHRKNLQGTGIVSQIVDIVKERVK